jgi:ABC-type spermidine/putrescine transport system permease subunit II
MLAALGITLPAPVLGISVIWLLNRDHPFFIWLYDRTIVPPVLAILVRVLPLCFAALAWAFATLDQEALDAASLDGAGRVRRFLSIVVPQRWPILVVVTLAAFVMASGDLSASILTLPPGVETISRRLFGLIHAGVDDQVAAIGLVSWLGYLGIAFFSRYLLARAGVSK